MSRSTVTFKRIFRSLKSRGFTSTEIVRDVFPFVETLDTVVRTWDALRDYIKEDYSLKVLTDMVDLTINEGNFEKIFQGKKLHLETWYELRKLADMVVERLLFINENCKNFFTKVENIQKFEEVIEKLANILPFCKEIPDYFLLLTYQKKRFTEVANRLKERGLTDKETLEVIATLLDDTLEN